MIVVRWVGIMRPSWRVANIFLPHPTNILLPTFNRLALKPTLSISFHRWRAYMFVQDDADFLCSCLESYFLRLSLNFSINTPLLIVAVSKMPPRRAKKTRRKMPTRRTRTQARRTRKMAPTPSLGAEPRQPLAVHYLLMQKACLPSGLKT